MGKFENKRGVTSRETAEVDKAFNQATNASPAPKKLTPQQIESRKKAARNRKIAIISACAVVLVVLIGLIIGLIVSAGKDEDDGRILSNVCAGGVNLGGMTTDEAKSALHLATDNTFSKKDMLINLPDSSFTLSPADTGAKLDVDAVVEAAYNYGRTGTEEEQLEAQQNALTTIHTIALLPYLDLDLPYIQNAIQEFCGSYSSVMIQPTTVVNGDRPAYDPEHPDLTVIHQTMVITMGTPDYALDADELYDRVLDAYSLNEMEVTYQAPTLTEPDVPNAEALFTEFCVAPADATIDDVTFEVTPEVYGYGFDIDALQALIDEAEYGESIEITLDFILPDITAEDLTENLFLDILATHTASNSSSSSNWNTNLRLSCEAIDGFVIKAGEEFSFNDVVGRLTAQKGYQKAPGYVNGESVDILGGGVSQTASALYYCALMANLEILERHSHSYAVNFSELGMDANIDWGAQNLRFRNNTSSPIRIVATASNGSVTIQLFGVDELDYDVTLTYEIVTKHNPLTIYQTMAKENILGHKDGDVLQSGIVGYDVETYINKYDRETGELISKTPIDTSSYDKRDQIVVSIESEPPIVTDPTVPSEPVDPTDPTDATDPTDPTDATDPGVITDPDPVSGILDFFESLL